MALVTIQAPAVHDLKPSTAAQASDRTLDVSHGQNSSKGNIGIFQGPSYRATRLYMGIVVTMAHLRSAMQKMTLEQQAAYLRSVPREGIARLLLHYLSNRTGLNS